ncbi:zona pellucida sperm-binding protein 3-like [Pholidichthys leucotaenia]
MEARPVTVVVFVLACVGFSAARVPTNRWTEVQKPAVRGAESAAVAEPESEHSRQSAHRAVVLQSTVKPFSWKFPEEPVNLVTRPVAKHGLQQPTATNPVGIRCGESKIHVEVSQGLLGQGILVKPEEVTLGGCSATVVDDLTHVLSFEYDLHDCNSTLVFTKSTMVYAFTVAYNPREPGTSPITRKQSNVIRVECHYQRRHKVSNFLEPPPWVSHNSSASEGHIFFFLQLMASNWKSERTSNRYAVGDVINMQASTKQSIDSPLRVLVDSCTTTATSDPMSGPRKAFIKHNGCLGGRDSRSRFMPQFEPHKLQFQIEALGLYLQRTMYISCLLKVIPVSYQVTMENKACSFDEGRWREVSGKDRFCYCCDSMEDYGFCETRKSRDLGAQRARVAPPTAQANVTTAGDGKSPAGQHRRDDEPQLQQIRQEAEAYPACGLML